MTTKVVQTMRSSVGEISTWDEGYKRGSEVKSKGKEEPRERSFSLGSWVNGGSDRKNKESMSGTKAMVPLQKRRKKKGGGKEEKGPWGSKGGWISEVSTSFTVQPIKSTSLQTLATESQGRK